MGKVTRMAEVDVDQLKPYEKNAKIHGDDQIEKLCESIREYGFISPVLIDSDMNVIAGHGRLMAAKQLGMRTVPCQFIEGLSDAQRRAYILADNRLNEYSEWNLEAVAGERSKACSWKKQTSNLWNSSLTARKRKKQRRKKARKAKPKGKPGARGAHGAI